MEKRKLFFCTIVQAQDMLGYLQTQSTDKVRYSLNQKCLAVYPDTVICLYWSAVQSNNCPYAFGSEKTKKTKKTKKTITMSEGISVYPTFAV